MPNLSAPQNIFLNGLNTKFRAYVGGFGCVHADTKILTENGLMRIADITSPVRVVSWNEKDQKFQLSLSGGSFPKGKGNLYRVTTRRGEFDASGHHRIFSSSHKYQPVSDLTSQSTLNSCSGGLLSTMLESDQLSSLLDVQNYSKTDEDLMVRYADEARLYGQQFHEEVDACQSHFQEPIYAHKSNHQGDLFASLNTGDLTGQRPTHSHHGLYVDHAYMIRLAHQLPILFFFAVGQILTSLLERICDYPRKVMQSVLKFSRRHNTVKRSFVSRSYSHQLSKVDISSIKDLGEEVYYDMQVLETNNYVCENGLIHHNSGKTFIGCVDLLNFFGKHPGTRQGYFGISFPSIRDIFYPTFEEAAHMMGFTVVVREANKEVHVYRNGFYYGTVICRSMDKPSSIVGFKVSRALVDEIDVLPKDKASIAWKKIIARLRLKIDGVMNSIGVTTTPEGFLFVYDTFKNNPSESYSMVQASTYENAKFLPDDYIESLIESYPQELISAYLKGEFVNLKSGVVYTSFDRKTCDSKEMIQPGEELRIGMDFNVTNMSAVVYVLRGNVWHAVKEYSGIYDTPAMIETIKQKHPNHSIRIYPDASGGNRKSVDASTSDIALLEDARFRVYAHDSNPFVKDRIMATNAAFDNGLLKVNVDMCPELSQCFEQLAYDKNGQPDKGSNLDHLPDAGTYPIAYEMPIVKPAANVNIKFAI